MICPNCHNDIEPRLEDHSFDYGESHQGPAGTQHVEGSWECPMCDTELDKEEVERNMPEPDFDDYPDPDPYEADYYER